ncbi:hypothetical protein BH11BAC2_BH11BAC2_00280 [soil metagenome]
MTNYKLSNTHTTLPYELNFINENGNTHLFIKTNTLSLSDT